MVTYDNENKTKENKKWTMDKIEPQHTYTSAQVQVYVYAHSKIPGHIVWVLVSLTLYCALAENITPIPRKVIGNSEGRESRQNNYFITLKKVLTKKNL